MVKLIERLQYNVNLKKLKEYLIAIEKNIFYPKLNGISIQHRKNVAAPWNTIDGLESLRHYDKNCTEKDFNIVHSNFKNTEYEPGIIRSDLDMYMNGISVMNFLLSA